MALAVCLLFDPDTEHALRRLWDRLEDLGIPTLRTHTHRRHVPHLSYTVLRTFVVGEVAAAVERLPDGGPMVLHLDALGSFRRGRIWLAPAPTEDLLHRQRRVVDAVVGTGADLHRNYRPGSWTPHCTLSPRTRLTDLPRLAAAIYDVLPVDAVVDAAALVDSTTGERYALRIIP
ncbi:2'-5' RNA ligase family protein [Rhodococcus phenolicus]|uniref:2'-5' RNA ligase family protein n=1 Tax=Rhodococcus phenolicus TaxID=263849 RepID=UPI00082A097F|nr:2'-5' RNA ligase family protein [Rhodococcus phenolicus]